MAKKETEKAPKPSHDINDELVRELSASFDVSLERVWWTKSRKMKENGAISIRGIKATIRKVEDSFGNAPTLRSSWSQYFDDAYLVEDLEGGKEQSLKAILNVTIQGTRKAGGRDGFAEILEGVKTFKALAKKVEDMPKKESGEEDSEGGLSLADIKAAMAHADGVILLALTALRALEGDEALIHNFDNAGELSKFLKTMTANSRAVAVSHPVSA